MPHSSAYNVIRVEVQALPDPTPKRQAQRYGGSVSRWQTRATQLNREEAASARAAAATHGTTKGQLPRRFTERQQRINDIGEEGFVVAAPAARSTRNIRRGEW
jgi:hypothetical protein